MELYEKLMKPREKVHDDRVHIQQVATKEQARDPSCGICHPIRTKPKKDFWNFWKWYRKLTGAETYSENTVIEFNKKGISQEVNDMDELTRKVVQLIENMRYPLEKGIGITMDELIQKITLTAVSTDGFMEEIEKEEETEELSESDNESITSTISSIIENEDSIRESERFKRFWELYKEYEPRVKSFNKETVEAFEELIKVDDEMLSTLNQQNEEMIQIVIKNIQRMIRGLKYHGLRTEMKKLLEKIVNLVICSKKFRLSIEETRNNYTKLIILPQENEGRSLSPNLTQVEKFLILYQNEVPEVEEVDEEKVREALEDLLKLEYAESGKQVKAIQMKIIRAIKYSTRINKSDERDRIRYILTCSNGLILNVQQTQKNIRTIVAGSNVTSEETSPEKVQSPEKEDSDENEDTENKGKVKDKGKGKMKYLSCPGYGCDGYAPFGKSQYYQGETVQEIKCKKFNWKVPRAGQGMRGIIERHCRECHLGGKKKEFDGCNVCNWEWSMCRCKCRVHGDEADCPVENKEDCCRITELEYIIYQGKSETFRSLVKNKIYEWNGETYRLVDEEFKDDETGTFEEQENTKPTSENIFEDSEYDKAETSDNTKNIDEWLKNTSEYEQLKKQLEEVHLEKEKKKRRSRELKRKNQEDHEFSDEEVEEEEKVIKRTEIPSSPKYSENSESEKSQIIITEKPETTTTNSSTATYTPSSQGTFNIIFSNPATPPQVQTPPLILPMANEAQIAAIVTNMQAPKLEPYYGRDNEDPIHWLAKLQRTERQLQWGGAVAGNINAGDPLANIKLQVPFYLRETAAEWYEQDKDNITAVITRAKEIELAIFEENNRSKGINMQEMKQHIKQQIMEEMGLSNTAGQMTQQYQNTGIQSQNYQPNQNYQLPDTSNIITLEDPNFKGRIRYSDGSTLYQDARQLPINQKFYERTGRTEEPTEIHKLSARIAELEREKVRNRRQTNTCYNCGRTGHMQKECRQQRRNNATNCNYCKRTGHNENEC